jgi:hypothetical protein
LYVVNLDIHMLSQRFEEAMSQMASGEYGWTASDVPDVNKIWPIVTIVDGAIITATIQETQELNVLRQVNNIHTPNVCSRGK